MSRRRGSAIALTPSGVGPRVILDNVKVRGNFGVGLGVIPSGGATTGVVIDRSNFSANNIGLTAFSGGVIILGNSIVTGNTTGVGSNGGTVLSYKNNLINSNVTDGTPLGAAALN